MLKKMTGFIVICLVCVLAFSTVSFAQEETCITTRNADGGFTTEMSLEIYNSMEEYNEAI